MKNQTFILIASLVAFFVIQSCDKGHLTDLGNVIPKIIASKTQVYPNQPDTLLFTGAAATDSVSWSISPAGNSTVIAKANAASVIFSAQGTYVVTAQKTGGVSASITIKVEANTQTIKSDTGTTISNVTTSNSDTLQTVPITGDVIMATNYYRTPNRDSVLINFSPYTYLTNKYCLNGILQFKSVFGTDDSFSLDLVNIRESKGCAITTSAGTATSQSTVFKNKMLGFGTYPLKVTVSGVTYTGSFVVSAANVTFNWPYTSGVIIPLQVIN